MKAGYMQFADPNCGFSYGYQWNLSYQPWAKGRWYVLGYHEFCSSGWAVVDDFGNLVQVSS